MGKRNQKEEALLNILEPHVREAGAELIDLRRVSENGKHFLRLFIDKLGGVSIDDCERVSGQADPILDEMGEDWHDYLEVQSPGLDRPLETVREFRLHLEERVDVSLYQKKDGQKVFSGLLKDADENGITILLDNGLEETFTMEEMAQVKRSIVFDKE